MPEPTVSLHDFQRLRASCLEDGLLARTFRGNLRITKKGRNLVKIMAITDEEVALAVREATSLPWLDRREAFVSLVLLARQRSVRP